MLFVNRALAVALVSACGGSHEDLPGTTPVVEDKTVTISVDREQRHQKLEGFGAAIAWYDNWLTEHPHKGELYELVFGELGIDILRLRNRFRYQSDFTVESAEIVAEGSHSIGRDLTLVLSSWSPPRTLKANNKEDCVEMDDPEMCTLRRIDGAFPYEQFADYWNDSLDAYAELGIVPKFISIQNEPDFIPNGWEGCHFTPSETAQFPGYDRALDAVSQRLAERDDRPRILGPETIGINNSKVQQYAREMNLGQINGIAHHFYDGNTWLTPDEFIPALNSLRANFRDHPVMQTEFSASEAPDGAPFETAWLIHNALVEADAVGYIYWDLIWAGSGLVSLEYPMRQDDWSSERGYTIRPPYYSVKHFAHFTDPGYVRVGAESSSKSVRVSAFESPDADSLTLVVLNVSRAATSVELDASLYEYGSQLYLSSEDSYWQDLGEWPERRLPDESDESDESDEMDEVDRVDRTLELPGRSILTIVLTED